MRLRKWLALFVFANLTAEHFSEARPRLSDTCLKAAEQTLNQAEKKCGKKFKFSERSIPHQCEHYAVHELPERLIRRIRNLYRATQTPFGLDQKVPKVFADLMLIAENRFQACEERPKDRYHLASEREKVGEPTQDRLDLKAALDAGIISDRSYQKLKDDGFSVILVHVYPNGALVPLSAQKKKPTPVRQEPGWIAKPIPE